MTDVVEPAVREGMRGCLSDRRRQGRHGGVRSAASAVVDITVDGGAYTPARIEVAAGRPITLRFLRKDPSPCAEKVLFDALGVSTPLPIEPVELTVTPPAAGEYAFTCQMQMYRGTLVAS